MGFDLRDEAHPSVTHGINSKGAVCLSWEKAQTETRAKPTIPIHRKESENLTGKSVC